MFKVSGINAEVASNLLSAAHSEKAAFECKSYTVALLCYKMAMFWRGMQHDRMKAAVNDYRMSREAVEHYRASVEDLDFLADAWRNALDRVSFSRANYPNAKTARKAWKQEQRKRDILLTHWDESNGTWNFSGVVFG